MLEIIKKNWFQFIEFLFPINEKKHIIEIFFLNCSLYDFN
jgi:hypothetical protein